MIKLKNIILSIIHEADEDRKKKIQNKIDSIEANMQKKKELKNIKKKYADKQVDSTDAVKQQKTDQKDAEQNKKLRDRLKKAKEQLKSAK